MSADKHLLRRHSSPGVYFIFRIVFQNEASIESVRNFSKNLFTGCNPITTSKHKFNFLGHRT